MRRRGRSWTMIPLPYTLASSMAHCAFLNLTTGLTLSFRSSNYTPPEPRRLRSVNAIFATFVLSSGSFPLRDEAYKTYRSLWMKMVSIVNLCRCTPYNTRPRGCSRTFAPGLSDPRTSYYQYLWANRFVPTYLRFNLHYHLAPLQKPRSQTSNYRAEGA